MTTNTLGFHCNKHYMLMMGIGMVLSGCAIEPVPVTQNELTAITQADLGIVRKSVPSINAPLTLEEAIARALKYNLDHRTRLLEQALAAGNLEVGKFDLLPKLMTTAGYDWRDRENIRNSTDSVTGKPSLANPSISSEKDHFTGNMGLTWNLLDFGVSYYTARQNADRVLIASERRRKAMHTLIQNVRSAFWRAAAAEKLEARVNVTIKEAESALADSRRIENERIKSPSEALRYQRNLLESLRLLEGVSRELASARIELSGLIGITPGSRITIAEPKGIQFKPLDMTMERMEEIAMLNNADLREQFYNVRIAITETRKVITKLFPGISLDYSYHHDSDSYLINQDWTSAGVQIGFNLLNLLSMPAHMNVTETGVKLEENRRMALRMSVLTQLHLANFQYHDAMRQYLRAVDIAEVDGRLAQLALSQEQSQMGSKLDRISANVTFILSSARQYYAMAKEQEAVSKLKASLGMEPRLGDLNTISLLELTKTIQQFLAEDITTAPSLPIKAKSVAQPEKIGAAPELKTDAIVSGISNKEKTSTISPVRPHKPQPKKSKVISPPPTKIISPPPTEINSGPSIPPPPSVPAPVKP